MTKIKKGSILAYSLVILAMMIAIVSVMAVATMIEKKSASSTDFSVQAYQTADSGVQLSIKKINRSNEGATIGSVFAPDSCNSGIISDLSDAAEGLYNISFYKEDKTQITDCGASIDDVYSIKSIGTYKDTVRAVQVVIAKEGEEEGEIASNADVMILMDISSSMDAVQFKTVKDSAIALINALGDDDQAGVVAFCSSASVSHLDLDKLRSTSFINHIGSTCGGTNQGEAIGDAEDELGINGRESSPKYMILITDGAPSVGPAYDNNCRCSSATTTGYWDQNNADLAINNSTSAKNSDITIFTAGVGLNDLAMYNCPAFVPDGCKTRAISFLESISTSPDYFYSVENFDDLSATLLSLTE